MKTAEHIIETVDKLVRKYHTRDPYELCQLLGIQERLWELRKDKGLNLEELSKLTGISKSALGSYEKEDFKEINHGRTAG